MSRLTQEQRYAAKLMVIDKGLSISETARRMCLARSTVSAICRGLIPVKKREHCLYTDSYKSLLSSYIQSGNFTIPELSVKLDVSPATLYRIRTKLINQGKM